MFLQVDLGAVRPVTRFVVKHASAGGENEESDTREFNIQLSNEGKTFTTVASSTGGFVEERTEATTRIRVRTLATGDESLVDQPLVEGLDGPKRRVIDARDDLRRADD